MISKKLTTRIMNTMSDDLTKILAAAAEECSELAKECCKAIRHYSYNEERIISEMADVLIMLVALKETFGITDSELIALIEKVCERYEQA